MRRAPSYRHPVARTVAAALLATAPLAAAGPAAADSVELPSVSTVLAADAPCVRASPDKAADAPWSRRVLGLSRTWKLSEGEGVTVAVVDTGVGTDIPALSGRVTAAGDGGTDCVGHGSFAAGLIAAAPRAGSGVSGVAPGARILGVRGTDTRGATTAARLAAGIRTAADEGAGVIYVGRALGTGKEELTEAVAYASASDALVVAPVTPDSVPRDATGKPGELLPWYWPASAPGVLSVIDYGPGGSRPEGAPTVGGADLSAPGDALVSVGPKGAGHYFGSGSSFAAAHVAGAAALVRARHPEMTAAQVFRQLTETAYPSDTPRLDPYAAVTALLSGERGTVASPGPARVVAAAPTGPRERALILAGVGGGLVLLVAAAAVVIPLGRARGWRPPS
ncbi:S8 family serine peptidase [Streptomyces sp. NPDC007088]|uniref:S8 family serine peptidase n=1 Tax=Streptomyces sp. NPDC007088 TaxID=3364773 RepID=UPI0036745064